MYREEPIKITPDDWTLFRNLSVPFAIIKEEEKI